MKKLIKGFIVGFITCMVITSVVYAIPIKRTITVVYNGIKVYVDDKKIIPKDTNGKVVEPFTYNGTIYMPLRAISESIGKTVNYDSSSNSVHIGQKPVQIPKMTYTKDGIYTTNIEGKNYVNTVNIDNKYNCMTVGSSTYDKLMIYDEKILPAWDVDYMKPLVETKSFVIKNNSWWFEVYYYENNILPILSQPREKKSTYSKDGIDIYIDNNVEYVFPSDIIKIFCGEEYRLLYFPKDNFKLIKFEKIGESYGPDNYQVLITNIPCKVVKNHLSIEYAYFKNYILPQIKK